MLDPNLRVCYQLPFFWKLNSAVRRIGEIRSEVLPVAKMSRRVFSVLLLLLGASEGLLYPQDSETRETKSLNGVWDFRVSPSHDPDMGYREDWING